MLDSIVAVSGTDPKQNASKCQEVLDEATSFRVYDRWRDGCADHDASPLAYSIERILLSKVVKRTTQIRFAGCTGVSV